MTDSHTTNRELALEIFKATHPIDDWENLEFLEECLAATIEILGRSK